MLLITACCVASVMEIRAQSLAPEKLEIDSDHWDIKELGWRHIATRPMLPDSCDIPRLEKKTFWRAGAETVGFNLGLWAFDRYVQKGDFAYISWNSIKENFKHGFEWDDDYLPTNMFAHPYSGSLYYNAGRSNGYNFWQSELFAIGGSAMWELFMEKEYPSTNDVIATPIGGAALGEVFYRTSDLLIDDRTTGASRFGRELGVFILNPMRGFTRLVTGRAWQHRSTPGRRFGIPEISVDISLGTRMLTYHDYKSTIKAGAVAELNIEYGDRFASECRAPYDYFSMQLELQAMATQPMLGRLEVMGRLLCKEVVDGRNLKLNVGLYQHFDYFDSDTIHFDKVVTPKWIPCAVPYKFGTPASIGGGAMIRLAPKPTMVVDAYVHGNAVIIAGVLTDFYRDYHRNYNWGSGFSIKGGLQWGLANHKLNVSVANQIYRIYTWSGYSSDFNWSLVPDGQPVGIQGDESNSTFNHFEASASYRVWQRLYLTGGIDIYSRQTNYKSYKISTPTWTTYSPIIKSHQVGVHLMLTYKI